MRSMFSRKSLYVLAIVVASSLALSGVELVVLDSLNQLMNKSGKTYDLFLQEWPFLLIGGLIFRLLMGVIVTGVQSFAVFTIQKDIYTEIINRMKPELVCASGSRETSAIARKILLDVSNFTNGVLLSSTNVITEIMIGIVYALFIINSGAINLKDYGLVIIPLIVILAISVILISKQLHKLGTQRQHFEKQRFFYPFTLINNYIE